MPLFKKLFSAKYGLIKQYDQIDCGPASLLSVLKFYGGNTSLVQLRELTNTSVNGSTMLDLVNAAKKIGVAAFVAISTAFMGHSIILKPYYTE